MPFIHYDEIEREYVTPEHSIAYGALAAGDAIEVGLLSFKGGEGAHPHQHAHEQIVVVLKGRIRARIGDEEQELVPGSGFHVPANVPHGVTAIEDSEVLSCKNLVDGKGHRL